MPSTTVDPALPVLEHRGRVLNWRPRFDERSMAYRIGAGVTELPATGRLWAHGDVINQGREGMCVGAGCAGEAAAEPVPVPGADTFQFALRLYKGAQRRDEWPGERYSGTSVLAGMQEGQAQGLWRGYRWAKSAEELAAGIVAPKSRGGGPGVIGVEWRDGSYDTDALGVLRPSGNIVGGHCLCVVGFLPDPAASWWRTGTGHRLLRQLRELGLLEGWDFIGGPAFVILNSWGPSFGKQGLALVPVDVMRGWVRAGGEFAIPEGRTMPEEHTPTTAAAEQPATASPDETMHMAALEVQKGDRIVEGVPAELGQETVTVRGRRVVAGVGGDRVRIRATAGRFTLRASDPVTVRRPVA